jgi:poly-gamma-glutamate capsule biosynthesis protein CapA/YwtB (metallophosphatase superfamily)
LGVAGQIQSMAPHEKTVIALTGDVMLGREVNRAIRRWGTVYPWGDMLDELLQADLRLINLECDISTGGSRWSKTPKTFFFRAAPAAIETLKSAEIDCVSLANNHSLDYGEPALLETLERLDNADIKVAGAGRNHREASRPALLQAGSLSVAVIALTDNEPQWESTETEPGVNYVPIWTHGPVFERMRRITAKAAERADVAIVSAHWGPNMVERPPEEFRAFARAMIDAGADIWHGHSAHIFQGIEIYNGRPILYDTGDFIDDYVVDPELRNDLSFLYRVILEDGRPRRLEMMPTIISDYQVNAALGRDAGWALNRLRGLCHEMGTDGEIRDGRLYIDIEPKAHRGAA